MARRVHGQILPLLLLAVCSCLLHLLQVSECSRPPPSPPPAADHLDDDTLHHHHQLLLLDAEQARTAARPPTCSTEVAGDGRTGAAAAPSSASATPARAAGAVDVASLRPRQTSDRALLLVRAAGTMPLRSKVARRFLAGAAVDGASCGSFNPHTKCPPAGKP